LDFEAIFLGDTRAAKYRGGRAFRAGHARDEPEWVFVFTADFAQDATQQADGIGVLGADE
jgi:hypothetical protein